MQLDIERLIRGFWWPRYARGSVDGGFPDEPVSRAAIYKWRERGTLPLAQLNKLARLAADQGKQFNFNDYLAGATAAVQRRSPDMGDRLYIFDTTLRDGEQSPGAAMTKEEKIRIARQLEKLGVDVIEAGFAAASPGDADAIQNAIAEHHRRNQHRLFVWLVPMSAMYAPLVKPLQGCETRQAYPHLYRDQPNPYGDTSCA